MAGCIIGDMAPSRLILVLLSCVLGSAAVDAAEPSLDSRIRNVVAGLRPAKAAEGMSPLSLSQRMSDYRVPGVSIAVVRNGVIDWARGYGIARDDVAVTSDTLFQAASISKPVAAMVTMALVQEGRLDLDADVNDTLTSWKVPAHPFSAKVTLRGVLSHSAGVIVVAGAQHGYAADADLPSLVDMLSGRPPAKTVPIIVDRAPGIVRYSNAGYVVLQQILTDATGRPFADLAEEMVLRPLGMTRSRFEQPLAPARQAEAAAAYFRDGGPRPTLAYPQLASAGLWTTPSDLARFTIVLQEALAGRSNPVLSQATARIMLTAALFRQGLGIGVHVASGRRFFMHDGWTYGFRSSLVFFEAGDGVAIMVNADHGDALIEEIRAAVAKEYGWPEFSP